MSTIPFHPLDNLLALRDRRDRPSEPTRSRRERETTGSRLPLSAHRVGTTSRRGIAVLVVFSLMFGYVAYQLVELQVLEPERWAGQADRQANRTLAISAPRGRIVDRNGQELAITVNRRTLFTDPRMVTDPHGAASALAPVLGIPTEDLETKLTADNRFGYLSRQMPDEVADQVEAILADPSHPMEGVYFLEEPTRVLPAGDIAGSLIGLTDRDNVGLSGIEAMFDDLLTGVPGRLEVEKAPGGRTIPTGHRSMTPAVPGGEVQLTIDQALQYQAEKALASQLAEVDAVSGVVVVTVPRTGEVLAMASVVRDRETGETQVSGNNAALTTVYEPGSIMKVITMSGVLEEGLITPADTVEVPDSLQVSNHRFTEYKPHGLGAWPLGDILVRSSNTGTIKLAQMLGPERLEEYFGRFGLGKKTDIEFPNEASGVVHPASEWSGTSIGSMPIGQGISVTPAQMLGVYNSIANGGLHVPLRLVKGYTDSDGRYASPRQAEPRQVVSSSTAGMVREMLQATVAEGTGTRAQVPGYTAAGKTGTALKPYKGGYVGPDGRTEYIGSFVGFAPATNPAISMIVMIDDPRSGLYTGGLVAAPVFSEIAQFALRRMEVPSVVSNDANDAVQDDKIRAIAALPPMAEAAEEGSVSATTIASEGR